MSHSDEIYLIIALVCLLFASAFFSAAETGLMAINRYRLRHKASMGKRSAARILQLLKRPDRLLGVILIGNTFANIFASSIVTFLAVNWFASDITIVITTFLLTFFVLTFVEVAPKTLAAVYPETVANFSARALSLLLTILYPLVWLVNAIANTFLRLFGVKLTGGTAEDLSRDELRSVIYEAGGRVPNRYQTMLLGILDLNNVVVDDIMVPSHEVQGLDLAEEWPVLQKKLLLCQEDWLPIYKESIDEVVGVLYLRDLLNLVVQEDFNKDTMQAVMKEPYFVPEGTPLNTQLLNFQQKKQQIAFVVDEYGEVLGLVTLEDILEEIVGEFTDTMVGENKLLLEETKGSVLVDGAITIRHLNRAKHWALPVGGPRTLSGLIIEHLESLPPVGVCVKIADYPIEVVEVKENRVTLARVFPPL